MQHTEPHSGGYFIFPLEQLYWKATSGNNAWRLEFERLEQQIKEHLSDNEQGKLLRLSRSYQRLRLFTR